MRLNQPNHTGELIYQQYALSKCIYGITQYYTANKHTDDIASHKKTKAGSSNSIQVNEYPDCTQESVHRWPMEAHSQHVGGWYIIPHGQRVRK